MLSRNCIVFLTVCVALFLYLFAYDAVYVVRHFSISEEMISKMSDQNLRRIKFYNRTPSLPDNNPYRWLQIKETYEFLNELRDRTVLSHHKIFEECSSLTVMERIQTSDCRAEWMYALEAGKVVAIENMMGFISGKRAGFEVILEDGRRAMYKPCSGPGEYPENEVRASHLDYALGFNRAPVSVSRNFTVNFFRDIAKKQKQEMLAPAFDNKLIILDQMEAACSDRGVFFGTMIGWVDGLKWTKTFPKRLSETSFTEIEVFRQQNDENYVAEVFQNHFMFYMIGIIRPIGKNEYELSTGELMTVDLDRVHWKLSSKNEIAKDLSFCYFCKIKQKTLEQIQEASEDATLSTTLRHSLLYDLGYLTVTLEEQKIIDQRLQSFFSQCFEPCIAKYSLSDVIVP